MLQSCRRGGVPGRLCSPPDIATDFEIDGEFPRYGNNDERADEIAVNLLRKLDVYKRQVFVLALIKFTRVTGKKWLTTAVPICLAVTCAIGFMFFCIFQVIQNILGYNIPWVSRGI